jgi:hypothetical protein
MPEGDIGSQGESWKLSVQKVWSCQFREKAPVRPKKNQGEGTQGQKIKGTRPFLTKTAMPETAALRKIFKCVTSIPGQFGNHLF